MNMLLNYQKKVEIDQNHYLSVGEDGYPYAADGILIVADGLGGRGGFPHSKINEEILDKDMFCDIALNQVFPNLEKDFKAFVLESFKDLFERKDYYMKDSNTMCHSGYFASRLVTAVVLYELKYNPEFKKEIIFEKKNKLSIADFDLFLNTIIEKLIEIICEKLDKLAANMGLVLESKITGSYLLPTTLVVALTNETEKEVEVIYLWAGDSRGYVLDKDGLAQNTDDHEKGETMYNLISLTKPFELETRYQTFKKPCILFNATDGVYKCACFASPLDLEYLMLDTICQSTNFEMVARIFNEFMKEEGNHDDSNTIALLTFGYSDFAQVVKDAAKRKEYIDKNIVKILPDIFTRNYDEELETLNNELNKNLYSLKDELIKVPAIVDYVKDISCNRKNVSREYTELQNKFNKFSKDKSKYETKIKKWVEHYWLLTPCMRKYSDMKNNPVILQMNLKKLKVLEYKDNAFVLKSEYKNLLNDYTSRYNDVANKLKKIFNDLEENDMGKFLSWQANENFQKYIKNLLDCLIMCSGELDDLILKPSITNKNFVYDCNRVMRYTNSVVKEEEPYVNDVVSKIINKEIKIESLKEVNEAFELLQKYLVNIDKKNAAISNIREEMNAYSSKPSDILPYWERNANSLISKIYDSERHLIPETILKTLQLKNAKTEEQKAPIVAAIEKRNSLYKEYSNNYNRNFRESKLYDSCKRI